MQTSNWIPTLIGKYQQALEVLSNKDFTRVEAVEYLKTLHLETGICNYLEKENIVLKETIQCITSQGDSQASLVYMQLQAYMQQNCHGKAYFAPFPSLVYSTEQVTTSIKTRLQHLHKMAELYS